MTLMTIPNSDEMCRIAEHCSGVATRQELDDLTRPRGIIAWIIDFLFSGGVREENAKPYEEFAQAMTTALIQEGSSDVHPYTFPERLVVDCFGYTIIFTLPGEIHNAAGPVTVEVCKGSETAVTEVDKDKFCRISTALMLRHKGQLRSTSAVLTDNNGMNLQGANFFQANLHGLDLSEADLSSANLREADLREADLRGACLSRAVFCGANLNNSRLDRTDLTGADLRGADLRGANLRDADLRGAKLNGADLGDILQKGTLLNLPRWDFITLDTHLNHINNRTSGSLLTMMDSIDEHDIKLRMARELMTSLQKTWSSISAAALPLMDILSKPPYTDDAEINTWLGTLCERYLRRYNGQVLPVSEGVFNQSADLFTRRPELMLSHNGIFIQIIAQGMAEKSKPVMKEKAAALYETYLQLAPVKRYCSLEDFGDGEGKPDWADMHAVNFILLSAQPATVSAMLLSQASLTGMLRPLSDTAWNNVYLYKDMVNLSPAESPPLGELFAKEFPVFNLLYQYIQCRAKFLLLIKTLNLGHLETTFVSATRGKYSSTKLVSTAHQEMLKVIFAPKLTYSPDSGRYGLNAAHYEELLSAYGFASASDGEKGKTLLCLAALFTKYSSSAVFGTEKQSPEALRNYAYALMAKAHALDGSLVDRATFADWTNRLLGLKRAFSCSAVLSSLMVEHIRSRSPSVLAGIMPPAWN